MKCHRSTAWLLLLPLLFLAGCQGGEDITQYQVDRPKPKEQERLLGAIIPRPDGLNWFFKLVGPVSVVDEYQKDFHDLIRSVKPGEKPEANLTWTLPDGWKQEAGNEHRFATLTFGPGHGLELSVSRFGGGVLANVNRWLNELGVSQAPNEAELRQQKLIEDLLNNGLKIVLVTATGPGGRRAGMGMAPPPFAAPGAEPSLPKFEPPADWKRAAPTSPIVKAAFRLPDSQQKNPEVTISSLVGDGGGLLGNYQRWQEQLKLKPSDELPRDIKKLKVAGADAVYFDLLGPEGPEQQRTLVVAAEHGGLTWYFKLQARADLVARQKAAFEAFVESVRF